MSVVFIARSLKLVFDCLGGPENTPVTFSPRLSEEAKHLATILVSTSKEYRCL